MYGAQVDVKIRRGLGLLVVAVIALFVAAWGSSMMGDYFGAWRDVFNIVIGLAFIVGALGGLGLIAYGLLRGGKAG